ncbi:hypothetical protein BJP34_16345 [Moorena producens PAL-8-15-08-1]|uniref:Addiction module component n=1 Tax=Moorena producens PAL-8-15-08-1 TaxID=1458985 RepID=A0A1D8TTC7_9CYAN|nr:hypothetical protein [Moorena producens]AOX00803.1 hypothetical protein BJP34_16345 [Moorena producens PAL-8-15-08-1]
MKSQLQEAVNIAQSLSLAEQLELLKILSTIIQKNHALEIQTIPEGDNTDFSADCFRKSWQQAVTGQTLPISQIWEGIDID